MNQTINISLPRGLNELAQAQVKAGYYSSVSEVIRDALRKQFLEPIVPTYTMSPKSQQISQEAYEEYLKGKSIKFSSF